MRYFLVDFENVHSDGIVGVEQLTETDEMTVFYSANADSISFDVMTRLMECKAKINYYKIKRGGKNALDFQLSSYLGYLVATKPETEFFIISRDSGFDFALDLWQSGFAGGKPTVRRFPMLRTMLAWIGGVSIKAELSESDLVNEEMAIAESIGSVELELTSTEAETAAAAVADITAAVIELAEPAAVRGIAEPAVVKTITEPVTVEEPAEVPEPVKKPSHRRGRGRSHAVRKPAEPIAEKVEPKAEEKAEAPAEKPEKTEKAVAKPRKKAEESETVLSPDEQKWVTEFRNSSNGFHELYIGAVKKFGQKRGLEIYRSIK